MGRRIDPVGRVGRITPSGSTAGRGAQADATSAAQTAAVSENRRRVANPFILLSFRSFDRAGLPIDRAVIIPKGDVEDQARIKLISFQNCVTYRGRSVTDHGGRPPALLGRLRKIAAPATIAVGDISFAQG
ncbi:hypothetical protein K8I61_18520 [bacterium]|nr:hypothetical protein [bacterium]